MKNQAVRAVQLWLVCMFFLAAGANAQVSLIAKGTLTTSRAGFYHDLSGLHETLENGAAADLLGGLGSGMTWVSGNTFLAVPDRGPNAIPFNPGIDDTVGYINRFHTITMELKENHGAGLPFTITPRLEDTTLLHSLLPLAYGSGKDFDVPPGAPKENNLLRHFFTGRSDNFTPKQNSGFPFDGRFDPESIRVSRDEQTVFISDEYGPYIYQFLRANGERVRTFTLPDEFYVQTPNTTTTSEQNGNSSGRVPNKGMEGLAITPDGRRLVGIMQNALIQDANEGAAAVNLLRMVVIDIPSGRTIHQFAYLLTTGSGVSDITALNDHEFLVDERDGKGLGDGSKAKVKQLFKIDLKNAVDISNMSGTEAATHGVPKTLFLDMVQVLNANGITNDQIPAKIEGITLGPDVNLKHGQKMHTIWIANDNDFEQDFGGVANSNPNQFFVFGFTDADLAGSKLKPQEHSGGFDFDFFF